jgi:hypothetical protein
MWLSFPLVDEPLTTDIKYPQVLEHGFFTYSQRKGTDQTTSCSKLGKLKVCSASDSIVQCSLTVFLTRRNA